MRRQLSANFGLRSCCILVITITTVLIVIRTNKAIIIVFVVIVIFIVVRGPPALSRLLALKLLAALLFGKGEGFTAELGVVWVPGLRRWDAV